MKNRILIVCCCSSLSFVGCKSLKVIKPSNLEYKLIYFHESVPFTGKVETQYSNGQLKEKSEFKNGQLYRQKFYYENGCIAEEGLKKGGNMIWSKTYYESGNVRRIADYRTKTVKVYYENNNLYSEGAFYVDPDALEGEWISYYENGNISAKRHFKRGDPDGQTISYYENGNIKKIAIYKDGWLEGECIHYYESGQIMEEAYYKGGALRGRRKTYYENGNMNEEAFHDDQGVYHGEYKQYYQNGGIWILKNFNHGYQVGNSVKYNENGEIISN